MTVMVIISGVQQPQKGSNAPRNGKGQTCSTSNIL